VSSLEELRQKIDAIDQELVHLINERAKVVVEVGKIKMADKTFELLKRFNGKKASVHGRTQIRAGVIRPEIIIPLSFEAEELVVPEAKLPVLEPGALIRIIRQPNFGKIAKVTGLPEELTKVESETLVRILEAEFEDGTRFRIPRANVEVIET